MWWTSFNMMYCTSSLLPLPSFPSALQPCKWTSRVRLFHARKGCAVACGGKPAPLDLQKERDKESGVVVGAVVPMCCMTAATEASTLSIPIASCKAEAQMTALSEGPSGHVTVCILVPALAHLPSKAGPFFRVLARHALDAKARQRWRLTAGIQL